MDETFDETSKLFPNDYWERNGNIHPWINDIKLLSDLSIDFNNWKIQYVKIRQVLRVDLSICSNCDHNYFTLDAKRIHGY